MIPNSFSTNNSLTIKEPVKIQLSLEKNTMLFIGFIAMAGILYGVKKIKR